MNLFVVEKKIFIFSAKNFPRHRYKVHSRYVSIGREYQNLRKGSIAGKTLRKVYSWGKKEVTDIEFLSFFPPFIKESNAFRCMCLQITSWSQ